MLENILGQPASHQRLLELHAHSLPQVRNCAAILRRARGRIVFTGMGASLFALLPAVSLLEQQGYAVQAIESAELLHYGIAGLRQDDVVVLVSRSGGSIEVLRLAEKLRAAAIPIVAATNVPGSELEHRADGMLHIGAQADQLIAVQTYTGTVLKMLLLAEEVQAESSERLSDACAAALPALRLTINECLAASDSWRPLLDSPQPLYLLGRGSALAAVQEAALLMHETAKAAAVAMSSGQFRHGPVETVSRDFRAIVFGSPAATRELDRALLDDLSRMGALVRWIGPPRDQKSSSEDEKMLISWPETDPLLAPLFEVVPMQVAAYCAAQWRGIVPGDFRHASEITASETGFPSSQAGLARA
jgi:glucosamine--fructose-6-phosphate aminotransferase (isomerizing)